MLVFVVSRATVGAVSAWLYLLSLTYCTVGVLYCWPIVLLAYCTVDVLYCCYYFFNCLQIK